MHSQEKNGHTFFKRSGRLSALTVILIRLVLVYILLTLTVRFMGKRQIGEMQMSELVVAFMLSELATMPITDTTVPLLYSVLPILLLAIMEILTSFAFLHSPTLSRIVTGTPQIVIRYGTINRKGEVVVPCIYNWITDFSEGLTKIEKGKSWSIINQEGKVIVADCDRSTQWSKVEE